jgi:hypothetical protein
MNPPMNYRTVTFTREELFQRVWAEPLLKLAADIGVSDVGLAKACWRADIPLPGRGYWAKSSERRSVPPKLPKATAKTHATISFQVLVEPEILLPRPKKTARPDAVLVPATLEDPDRLVRISLKALRAAKVDDGRIRKTAGALAVHISPNVLDRALLLLDTLIKTCRDQGMPWSITDKGTFIQVAGIELNVILRERLTKQEVKPEPLPEKRGKRSRWEPNYSPSFPSFEWVSTNDLTFEVTTAANGSPQRRWADTRNNKLECRIADIVQGLPTVADGVKLLEAERERWRLEREEAERLRLESARRVEIERKRRLRLQTLITRASRAEQIRSLCDRLEITKTDACEELGAGTVEWLAWARNQADLLDPVHSDNEALFSLEVQLSSWFTGNSYSQVEPTWWAPVTE